MSVPRAAVAASVLLGLLLLGAIAAGPAPDADAATTGAGIPGITPYGGYLGNYVAPDGSRVYCIDAARDWPSGATGDGQVVDALSTEWGAALAPDTIAKFDYALRRYGQTADPVQAAALNAYLYAYTSGFARHHGAGREAGLHYIDGHAAVTAVFATIWADAEAHGVAPVPTATVTLTSTGPLTAVAVVGSSDPEAAGTLQLEGGVGPGGTTSSTVRAGDEVPVTAVPAADAAEYSLAAVVTLRVPAPPAVTVYLTGDQQRTIRDSGPREGAVAARDELGPLPVPLGVTLRSHVASDTVAAGTAAVDTLTLTADRPWPLVDGAPLVVTLSGTLYGPFPEAPLEAEAPPAGAPVVGTEALVVTGTDPVVGAGALAPTEPGFYSWVWSIEPGAQSSGARALLGTEPVTDRFGLPAETFEVVGPTLAATGAVPSAPLGALGAALGLVGLALTARRPRRSWGGPVPRASGEYPLRAGVHSSRE